MEPNVTVVPGRIAQEAAERHVPRLVEEKFASRLAAGDPTLWGSAAEQEASIRLGWTSLFDESLSLVPAITELRGRLADQGVDHIALCGMGGSSLAPEVITGTAGVELTVVDSTEPGQVRAALQERIRSTAVVVSSKSGSTLETDAQKRAFAQAFQEAGIDPAERIIVVTDPGSPLDQASREAGHTVINANPNVGGRYSALTAFGLVPSGLAGADIERLLLDARAASEILSRDDGSNPGLILGAAMAGTEPLRDKLAIVDAGSGLVGFGDWTEQLIAESTGKEQSGVLPVVVQDGDVETMGTMPDVLVAVLGGRDPEDFEVAVSGPLGAQMLLWEYATSVAGALLGTNPFDQPDVEAAKKAARGFLDSEEGIDAAAEPVFEDRGVQVFLEEGAGNILSGVGTLEGALTALLDTLAPDRGYLAVQAYLDRIGNAALAEIRDPLARAAGRPVTFGWGPRFLHSTGQYHKGGAPVGAFLQITAGTGTDLDIPGLPFSFGQVIAAQAAGDAQVLAGHGRPVVRLHLEDAETGIATLSAAVAALTGSARNRGNEKE